MPMWIPNTLYLEFLLKTKICLNLRIECFSLYSYNPEVLPYAYTEFQLFPLVILIMI